MNRRAEPAGLQAANLTVRYGDEPALVDVSLSVPQAEIYAIVGPSGCGKSTLLRAIAGLEPLVSGTVLLNGRDLARVPTYKRGIAMMFQEAQLFPQMNVARNIGYPLRLRRWSEAETGRRVDELLEMVSLPGYGDRDVSTLSGGERQRVDLARSLAASPQAVLLDEPLSALDADLRARLARQLREVLVRAGTTALFVTHDRSEAHAIGDAVVQMDAKRIQAAAESKLRQKGSPGSEMG